MVDVVEDDRPRARRRPGRRSRARPGSARPARPPPRSRPRRARRARSSPRRAAAPRTCRPARIVADARQQHGEELVELEVRERGVRDRLDVLEPLARAPLGLEQARVLDRERGAVGRELEQLDLVARERRAASSVPTWSTPITSPSTRSGTPSIDLIPFSRRIGLRTSAWSTSSRITGRRSAATRPAKPRPTGIRTPCSTSSSIPTAARATSSFVSSSSSSIAHVSTSRSSRVRSEQRGEQLVELEVRERGVGERLEAAQAIGVGVIGHRALGVPRSCRREGRSGRPG